MVASDNGQIIGADFVCRVPVMGDAVSTDNDHIDFVARHKISRHRVAHQGARNLVLVQFPHGELGALVAWAGLVNIHMYFFALFESATNDTNGGAPSANSQRSGVAVRDHVCLRWKQSRSKFTQFFVCLNMLLEHALG